MASIQIVAPHAEMITPKYRPNWNKEALSIIEECGRVSHKSEGRIKEGSAAPFIKKIAIEYGHSSIVEHDVFTVCFIGSRSFSHQLVRTRISSYTQASQRYCDYSSDKMAPDNTLQVIMPPSILGGSEALWNSVITKNERGELVVSKLNVSGSLYDFLLGEGVSKEQAKRGVKWCRKQIKAYKAYLKDRQSGVPAEDARFHLTNACKTEVYTTMNYRMWRHVLGDPVLGRALNPHAQWEIKMVTKQVLDYFLNHIPVLFEDLVVNNKDQ